jgi:L-asparaginase
VQGTDNIEETAFAWDLLPLPAKPVVVVGAMRSASQTGYDGPGNLVNAVRVAADTRFADQGVVVAMAGSIHGADAVRKTHTHAYETFQSVNAGALGYVNDTDVRLTRRRERVALAAFPSQIPSVALVTALLGEEAPRIPDHARGVVIQAMGGGNTQLAVLDAARAAIAHGSVIVLATRCPAGSVRPGYSFPGGSTTWWHAGAIFSGSLDGLKARVALMLSLGARYDHTAIVQLFEHYGGGARASDD